MNETSSMEEIEKRFNTFDYYYGDKWQQFLFENSLEYNFGKEKTVSLTTIIHLILFNILLQNFCMLYMFDKVNSILCL